MKIIVTGTNGQLGKCIRDAVELYDRENTYFFLDRGNLDIADHDNIVSVLDSIEPNVIINCAAYVKTDNAEGGERVNAYLANALGPTYLAIECKERGIELIHISTDYVFDGEKPTAYATGDEPNPLNIYGVSKYCGEKAISDILGTDAIIIRTSWLYSAYGENFLTKTLKNIYKALKSNENLRYVVDQIGCPTYAVNLAKFIVQNLIVEQQDAVIRNGITYHYTDEGIASRYDFAKAIEKEFFDSDNIVLGCESSDFEDKAKRPKCCILSKKELLNDFNCEIKDWRTSLHECAEIAKNMMPRILGLPLVEVSDGHGSV